jgi:hypothetical protein
MTLKPPPSPTMVSRLFAKLSRIRSIAPVNLKTSVPRCSPYAYVAPARPKLSTELRSLGDSERRPRLGSPPRHHCLRQTAVPPGACLSRRRRRETSRFQRFLVETCHPKMSISSCHSRLHRQSEPSMLPAGSGVGAPTCTRASITDRNVRVGGSR